MSADEKQVGGEHYKNHGDRLQHWNVVAEMGWDYFIGNATKYLWRLGEKGDHEKAIEDISKSIHYLEKKRELMMVEKHESLTPQPNTQGLNQFTNPSPYKNATIRKLLDAVDTARAYAQEGPGPGYINQDR